MSRVVDVTIGKVEKKEFTHVIADLSGLYYDVNIGDKCKILEEDSSGMAKVAIKTRKGETITQFVSKTGSQIIPIIDLGDTIYPGNRCVFETRVVSDSEKGDYSTKKDKWEIPDDYLERYLALDRGHTLQTQDNEKAKELAKTYFAPFSVKFAGEHICVKVTKESAE